MLLLSHALTVSPAEGLRLSLTQALSLSLRQAPRRSLPEPLTQVLNKDLILSVTVVFTLSPGHFLTLYLYLNVTLSLAKVEPLMPTKGLMLCVTQALT